MGAGLVAGGVPLVLSAKTARAVSVNINAILIHTPFFYSLHRTCKRTSIHAMRLHQSFYFLTALLSRVKISFNRLTHRGADLQ
jgi:hypothetical protein